MGCGDVDKKFFFFFTPNSTFLDFYTKFEHKYSLYVAKRGALNEVHNEVHNEVQNEVHNVVSLVLNVVSLVLNEVLCI